MACSTALKLALLEELSERGPEALEAFRKQGLNAPSFGIGNIITSLRFIGERRLAQHSIEPLSVVHRMLLDPAGVYPRMDFESRDLYRLSDRESRRAVPTWMSLNSPAEVSQWPAKQSSSRDAPKQ